MLLENLIEPVLTKNSVIVLEKRYLRKDGYGNTIETPKEMFYRVAKNVASADSFYRPDKAYEKTVSDFYKMMAKLEFLPNSPTLMNAGTDLGQLSACFVLPIDDSMESIFQTLKDTAIIHKSGGGTGFSFSNLRPKSSIVRSTGGVASGPISFMKVYNAATEAVKQGGTRRGANMGILRVDHPDIIDFIQCKEQEKTITNFNISVAITDEFMNKLEREEEYELIDPRTKKSVRKISTKEVFGLITEYAHKNGEPGVIFIDRMNQYNPTPEIGKIESTNPCGEQPLLPYESCNLGSINLGKFVKDKKIDYGRLEGIVQKAVHFLDNVIDMNKYPIPQIEEKTKANRKIGLGVMGFADMLIQLGTPYNSPEGVHTAETLMTFIDQKAKEASEKLADERGAFPNFDKSIYKHGKKIRNATRTTIAPTGSISAIASPCSSGIEPIFAISYYKNVMDNTKLVETNHSFEEIAKERKFYSEGLMKKIAETGSIQDIKEIPEDIRKLFVTAHDISVEYHVKMQTSFQKHTDNAVSKTINFPNNATLEDVRKAYIKGFDSGCKGLTIYRDKSREEQVLNIGNLETITKELKIAPRSRPESLKGETTKINTGCGNLYVTMNYDEKGKPFELFVQMGKAGGCAASQLEALGRLTSLAFRAGIDTKEIEDQLKNIRCPSPSFRKGGGRIFSCADAIAKTLNENHGNNNKNSLEDALKPKMKHSKEDDINDNHTRGNVVGVCPDCHSPLVHEEGCEKCPNCAFTKC